MNTKSLYKICTAVALILSLASCGQDRHDSDQQSAVSKNDASKQVAPTETAKEFIERVEAEGKILSKEVAAAYCCLLYTSPSPRDLSTSRMPSSA